MKKLSCIKYLFLLAICVQLCGAADVKTQTIPACYVGNIAKVPAQMAWKVSCIYYSKIDYKQILANASSNAPDSVLARYFDYFKHGGNADFGGYAKFYDPNVDQSDLKDSFTDAKSDSETMKDIKFVSRYDVGQISLIAFTFTTDGPDSERMGIRILKKTEAGWVMIIKDYLTLSAGCLAELDAGNRLYNFTGTLASKYQYSMQVPGLASDTNATLNPSTLLFNGKAYDLKLGKDAQPVDALSGFVNRAWMVSKEGTEAEWLKLFTKEEATLREGDLKDDVVSKTNYFPAKIATLVFAIDFGPQAVAFLEDVDHPMSQLQPLLLWKGTTTDYKLTDVTANVTDKAPYEMSFPANIQKMFGLKDFQDGLRKAINEKASAK